MPDGAPPTSTAAMTSSPVVFSWRLPVMVLPLVTVVPLAQELSNWAMPDHSDSVSRSQVDTPPAHATVTEVTWAAFTHQATQSDTCEVPPSVGSAMEHSGGVCAVSAVFAALTETCQTLVPPVLSVMLTGATYWPLL